jgi:8-oxo-dGTP pyrophosphatase MutT (NUDIX family)
MPKTSATPGQQAKPAGRSEGFLSELASYADVLFHGPVYEQYAAICYRRHPDLGMAEVLVVTSRESGRWIVPKGWPIKGKKPYEVAAIEAFEEAGVRGKIKKKRFGYFTYLKQLPDDSRVPCIVQLHLLEVEKTFENFPERGQRLSEWVSFTEAARRVREPELKGLFLEAERKMQRPKTKEKK